MGLKKLYFRKGKGTMDCIEYKLIQAENCLPFDIGTDLPSVKLQELLLHSNKKEIYDEIIITAGGM